MFFNLSEGEASYKKFVLILFYSLFLQLLVPKDIIGDSLHVNDRYIMAGDVYKRLRTSINNSFEQRSCAPFEEELNRSSRSTSIGINSLFPLVAMALYKNVTTLYKDMPSVPHDFFDASLGKLFARHRHHWEPLLENSLTHQLHISSDTWTSIELALLLVQLKFALLFSSSQLVVPLVSIIESPAQHANSFLPCMPQDSLFDIHQAVREGVQPGSENPTFYACPNGHPYVLFNCGRPWTIFNCKVNWITEISLQLLTWSYKTGTI